MTPEQKAWFEYGRSRGWLKAHRSKKYFADVPDMGLSFWHMQRNMCGLNALIRDHMAEAGRVQGVDVFKGAKLQKLHAPSSRHEIWFPLFLLHRY